MGYLALFLSLLVAALGALGVVSPARLVDFVRRFEKPGGLYVAAGFRIVFGLALFLAAPDSRAPAAVAAFGVLVVAGGIATPLIGPERFRRLLVWWEGRGPVFMRTWAGLALVLGLLLAYALSP